MRAKAFPIESPLVRSYRELLGVDPRTSLEDIKKAYRKLATLYHPDRNPDPQAQKHFIKITQAYEALTDPLQLERLNQKFVKEQLQDRIIEGLNIRFGSFFGYRVFSSQSRLPRAFRIGKEKPRESDDDIGVFDFRIVEESHSILDHPAFDSLELVYGGKFSLGDEERVQKGFRGTDLGGLPWIVLNNRGILQFLEGKFEKSLESYLELNERIPNNIIFLYRLGLCYSIEAFRRKKKNWLGRGVPDGNYLKKGVQCFRKAIAIGEGRSVGKQKCLTIRKTLAEVLEKSGQLQAAKKVWQQVRDLDPKSKEAIYKLQGPVRLLDKP